MLVVKKDLPPSTLQEFIAYARARPGKINFGATGYGGLAHLVGEVFMQQTGISVQYVQYKGGLQGTTDLLGGTIDTNDELGRCSGTGRQHEIEYPCGRK